MSPSVDKDAAAALRTVGDAQSIDARGVAPEAARERISSCTRVRPASVGRKQRRAVRENAGDCVIRLERILSVEVHSLRQDRNCRSFQRSHKTWFLQQLGQVAVERGGPANNGLQRQPIYLWIVFTCGETIPPRARATSCTRRVIRISAGCGRTIDRQSKQTNDLPAQGSPSPCGRFFCFGDLSAAPPASQRARLPNEKVFIVFGGPGGSTRPRR